MAHISFFRVGLKIEIFVSRSARKPECYTRDMRTSSLDAYLEISCYTKNRGMRQASGSRIESLCCAGEEASASIIDRSCLCFVLLVLVKETGVLVCVMLRRVFLFYRKL